MSKKIEQKFKLQKRPVAPIYAFAITWVIGIFVVGISPTIGGILPLAISSFAVSGVVNFVCWDLQRGRKDVKIENILKSELVQSKSPDAEIILEALDLLKEAEILNSEMKNQNILQATNDIVKTASSILDKITKKPELVSSIRRFFNHYLPTTVKLLKDYRNLENQAVKSENIFNSMEKIEQGIMMLKDAFQKQLDTLFSHTALDLEADIDVLESILKNEGLMDNNPMGIPSHEKENEV